MPSFAIDIAMAALYLHFVAAHYAVFAVTHGWQVGLVVAQETMLVGLFLARRPVKTMSLEIGDWLSAGVGTFGPLLLHPTGANAVATAMQMAGLCVSMASLASLRRSFGIVAAWRKTMTSGMYSVVRHPQYAGHHLLLVGYLLASPSVWNAVCVSLTIGALWLRIMAEENVLLEASAEYRDYAVRVPWRVVPGVL